MMSGIVNNLILLAQTAPKNNNQENPVVSFVGAILWIIIFICVEGLYHKVFDVYYLGSNGCVTEIFICGFISMIITAIILVAFSKLIKVLLVVAAIIAVLVIIGAIANKKGNKKDGENNTKTKD